MQVPVLHGSPRHASALPLQTRILQNLKSASNNDKPWIRRPERIY